MTTNSLRQELVDRALYLGIDPHRISSEKLELLIEATERGCSVTQDMSIRELEELVEDDFDEKNDSEEEDGYDPYEWGECPHGNRDDEGCDHPGCNGGVDGFDEECVDDDF